MDIKERQQSIWTRYGYATALAVSGALTVVSSLRYLWVGPSYAWPDPLYILINGLAILPALPIAWKCLYLLFAKTRVTADLLLLVIAGAAMGTGHWLEAAVVAVLSLLAAVLRSAAFHMSRAAQSASGVMGRRVTIRDGASMKEVALQEVKPNDVVVVRQGQMIPVDGKVVEGRAEVREEALTGESVYQVRIPGQRVLAGGMVESGTVDIVAEKVGEDTLLAHIDHLVSRALKRPSRRESALDRFAQYYVGAILLLGAVVFLVYGQFAFFAEKLSTLQALHRALLVMLAVSPAALVVAGPLTIYAGLLRAARRGILFRDADTLENLARVSTLLLDKTGTLTYANPRVAAVKVFGAVREEELLDAALMVERLSSHPIARAICRYGAEKNGSMETPDKFHEFEGGGACAQKDSQLIKVGALWLMEDGRAIAPEVMAWMEEARARRYTPVLVADRTRILGGFALEDAVREDASDIMRKLRAAGIGKLVMVTGDNRETAERVAKEVGVDEVEADCMPDKKMKRLAAERVGGRVVGMVGDGINDAPALAAADVGIAMGAMGSDLAIEAAGVALLHNDLLGLYEAVAGSRQTARAIGRAMGLAVGANILFLGLALAEWVTLVQGAWLQLLVLLLTSAHAAWLYCRTPSC